MSKKWIITLSVVIGLVAVLLISFWTLFGLSTVSVEYNTTKENISVSDSEIVKAGQFKKHSCVLFGGKKKAVQNILDYAKTNENFAYIRVLNIETKFPNKYIIHVAEREELFAVENGTQFLICDRDLRVLRIEDSFSSSVDNPIVVSGLTIKNQNVAVGDFLNVEQTGIKNLYSAMVANNRSYAEQIGKFEKMEISSYADEVTNIEYFSLHMETFSGRQFVVRNIDFALTQKLQKMFAVESSLFSMQTNTAGEIVDKNDNVIYLVKLDSGEYVTYDSEKHEESEKVALTYALLNNCLIQVDNFTISKYTKRTTKDIYYSLIALV